MDLDRPEASAELRRLWLMVQLVVPSAILLGAILSLLGSPLPFIAIVTIVLPVWVAVTIKVGSEGLRSWLKQGWVLAGLAIAGLWFGQIVGEDLRELVELCLFFLSGEGFDVHPIFPPLNNH